MNVWVVLGEIAFLLVILFFAVFSLNSFLEKEKRASGRSLTVLIMLIILNVITWFLALPWNSVIFAIAFIIICSLTLLVLVAPKPRKAIEIAREPARIDERDVIFARFDLRQETSRYEEYYTRKPDLKTVDDAIRSFPDLLTSEHMTRNPSLQTLAEAEFDFLEHLLTRVDGRVHKEKRLEQFPSENTAMVKHIAHYLGADLCGVAELDQAFVYSHVGRGPEPYGQVIQQTHKYAIAFSVEMNPAMVSAAPQAPVIVETAKKYVEAAKISVILAEFIRRLGYPARAHIAGSNYQAVLPPIAWEAGLGELGRLGTLITWTHGPRARLGLVTTDLPLDRDKPRIEGIQDFCEKCRKCAENCPSQAIPLGEKIEENGVRKWVINREACYRFWRQAGTDCAICMYVCPYSKPNNLFHSFIKKVVSASSAGQTLSILGDDLFYGRKPIQKRHLFDMLLIK